MDSGSKDMKEQLDYAKEMLSLTKQVNQAQEERHKITKSLLGLNQEEVTVRNIIKEQGKKMSKVDRDLASSMLKDIHRRKEGAKLAAKANTNRKGSKDRKTNVAS
jgi:hypothetical protein